MKSNRLTKNDAPGEAHWIVCLPFVVYTKR